MDFSKVNQLKDKLDQLRPLPPAALKNLKEYYKVEWTYHSNAIEGNTLSLMETKIVLEEGLTVGGKKLREHFEVINHAEAIDYIEEQVKQETEITHQLIKNLHYLVLKNIDNENAGQYRQLNVRISGSKHTPPHFLQVKNEMDQLISWYEKNKEELHAVELAALFHFKFVYIHPFVDGNGRTARLLMNLILMENGYPPAIVKAEDEKRYKYYEALENASMNDDYTPFIQLIMECVEESLSVYIEAVK
ncbi:Fic family protein [Bacillus piscicola]|uniref:Fic family protein n=1 Tax=Bacillus piscicola TaxID=1632684 RepID=UPI001F099468|nr:Fic family protein [Bacillus piscicola]